MKLRLLSLALMCSAAGFSHAQMTPPLPEQMKTLSVFLGDWSGDMKMMMPGATEAMNVPTVVKVTMHGVFQEMIYTLDMGEMGKFTGHTFVTWDEASKSYKGWGFDENAPEPRIDKGAWDGKRLVLTSEPHGGMVSRVSFEPKGKDEMMFLLEMKNGEKFEKMGEATYKRKS